MGHAAVTLTAPSGQTYAGFAVKPDPRVCTTIVDRIMRAATNAGSHDDQAWFARWIQPIMSPR